MKRLVRLVWIVLLLATPTVASAQVSWGGAYAGAEVGVAFKDLQFSVNDGFFGALVVNGTVNPRYSIGGHAGFDFPIKRFVIGGEGSVSYLDYTGQVSYGPNKDTTSTTKGGPAWSGMGRIGWTYRQVMPYFGVGILGSKNSATILDDCASAGCGTEVGEGSGKTTATHWVLAYGVQFASSKRIAGRDWALRIEWLQIESSPIVNTFPREARGSLVPGGSMTFTSTVTTPMPRGTVRILFDVRLTK